MFMALLFKSGFTAEVYSKFKARDPSLYNDDSTFARPPLSQGERLVPCTYAYSYTQ
jgi:hypothetical protein